MDNAYVNWLYDSAHDVLTGKKTGDQHFEDCKMWKDYEPKDEPPKQ